MSCSELVLFLLLLKEAHVITATVITAVKFWFVNHHTWVCEFDGKSDPHTLLSSHIMYILRMSPKKGHVHVTSIEYA